MTLGVWCSACGEYHSEPACARLRHRPNYRPNVNPLADLKPAPKSREHIWGYVVIVGLGIIAVLSLGWC